MNLLKKLQEEIEALGLFHKLEIARYIYIQLGLLFEYDPFYAFASKNIKKIIQNKRIAMQEVNEFYYVCFGWAHLYVDFLHAFNIPARVVNLGEHAYVEYFIDGKTFLADLTNDNEDFMRIKFHLPTVFNRQIAPTAPKIDRSFASIDSKFYDTKEAEIKIEQFVQKVLKLKKYLSHFEYMYMIFSLLKELLNTYPENKSGVVTGTKYIDYLLGQVLTVNECIMCYRYFNLESQISFQIYHVKEEKDLYFAYKQRQNDFFSFDEVKKEDVILEEKKHILQLKFPYKKQNTSLSNKHLIFPK